jgi:hypothetical protein
LISRRENDKLKKMKHLRYDLYEHEGKKSPAVVIKKLGIIYKYWIPQTIGDQIWILDCSDIPDNLPKAFSELKLSEESYKHWTE